MSGETSALAPFSAHGQACIKTASAPVLPQPAGISCNADNHDLTAQCFFSCCRDPNGLRYGVWNDERRAHGYACVHAHHARGHAAYAQTGQHAQPFAVLSNRAAHSEGGAGALCVVAFLAAGLSISWIPYYATLADDAGGTDAAGGVRPSPFPPPRVGTRSVSTSRSNLCVCMSSAAAHAHAGEKAEEGKSAPPAKNMRWLNAHVLKFARGALCTGMRCPRTRVAYVPCR